MILTEILKRLQDDIKDIVKDIKLQKEMTDGDYGNEPIYVSPYVEICHTPHKNFLPIGFQVPYIMVCFDDSEDNGQDNHYSIRLNFGVYGGGFYFDADGNETRIPDAKGYIDLLDLMERVKGEILKRGLVGGTSIILPYTMGVYEENNTWPYWYGYSQFKVMGLSDQVISPDNLLEGGL